MELADVAGSAEVTRGERAARWIVGAAVAVAAVQLLRFADTSRVLDDAFITFRIARTWVEHGTIGYNPGAAPIEGSTSPAWTALAALWLLVAPAQSLVAAARIFGGACHLASVVAIACAAHRLSRVRPAAAVIAAALVAASGSLAFHAQAGLETGLWELGVAVVLASAPVAGAAPPARAFACALAVLPWIRPEGVLVGAVAGGCAVAARGARWRVLLPFAASVLLQVALRWTLFHDVVPNTLRAKPPELAEGAIYVGRFLALGLGAAALVPLVLAVRDRRTAVPVGALVLLTALGVAASGGDWMPGERRLTPVVLGLAILCAVAITTTRGRTRALAGLCTAAWMAGTFFQSARSRDSGAYPPTAMADLGRAALGLGVRSVALVDIGQFGWAYPGEILDLAALTDPHLARLPGGHLEKWDEAYFREWSPEVALVQVVTRDPERPLDDAGFYARSPVEARLLEAIAARGGYRLEASVRIAADYYVLVHVREPVE